MKQMIKYTLVMATLLLVSLGAFAGGDATVKYKLDGNASSVDIVGTVVYSGGTITVTPKNGYYLEAADLTVYKLVAGSYANTRNGEPGFNTQVEITASNADADPSKATTYTFEVPGDEYDYEITANFHTRTSVENATVSGLKDSYTYTGEAIKPVVTVKVGDNTLTLDKDYRAFYSDSINASTDAVKGKITLYGIRKYMGTQQIEYIIAKADPTLTFSPTTATITFGRETAFEKPVLTTTPAGLAVTYQVKDGDNGVAQVNSDDGGITPLVPGQATIEAVFAGNANYNEAKGQYTLTVAKGTAVVTIAPVAKDNLIYNGGDQELVNGGTATDGTMMYRIGTEGDFSADIPKGNAAGEYTVYYKAVAINSDQFNDSEALSITATIKGKSIANATITLTPSENFTYNGQNQKPEVSVKDGETDLVLDQDYTLTNDGGTNVGKYTVTITGKGNYDSNTTTSKDFNITALDKAPTVALTNPDEAIVYDGTAKEPALTVSVVIKDGDAPTALTLNTDYTVVYSDNVNAGTNTAKATVTLKGNYKGTGSATFTIAPKSIGNVNISDIADQAYTGSAIQPTVTVKDGEKTLVLNTDYTISYSNNTAAAASTAENAPTVIVTGKGNYDPNTTATKKFTITPKSIANATITLDHENFVYNGQNQKPTVSVKDGNTDLLLDTDYTLTNEGGTNAGEYTVTVTGKGNYSGEVNKKYNITAATMEVTAEGYTGTYDGKAYGITVTAPEGATIKYGTVEGTYDLTTNPTYTNAGTYTVYYCVSMANYNDVKGSKNVAINPKSIDNATITLTPESFTYNGGNQKPTVSVKDGETELVLDTDYTLTNEGGTNAGEYTVTVTGKGNYEPTTKATKTFIISKTTITLSYSAATAEATMGEAFTAPTLDNPSKVAVTYSSSKTDVATISEEGVITLVGAGQTTITASFAGDGNYERASASYELTVEKRKDAGLSWSDKDLEGMEYFLGDWWFGPKLINPNNLPVKYESSDEDVATIDKNGVVTALAVGETWIKAIFEGNDEYEPQTIRYALMVKERYDLLVNDVRVTSDNCGNVLGDGHFFYDENTKQLVVTNNENPVTIESRLKNLTIFLNGSSKLERIFFNNEGNEQNTGSLTITTYDNIPGKVVLETTNANGVISGFSGLTIDKKSLTYLLDPVDGKYQGGKLVTAEGAVAMTATIGQYLKPLINGQTVTFPPGEFNIEDFTNKVIADILFTLLQRTGESEEEDDYYDPAENAIVLNNLNSTSGVTLLIDNVLKGELIPGSSDYAMQFKGGITFMVPSGEGTITLNLKTEPGYKLMLMIGDDTPKEITQNERGDVQFTYDVKEATYCCIYLVQAASTRGTRIGKRDRHHGTIYSIKVEPTKVRNMNPLGEVEGFPTYQKPEVVVHSSTGIKEIKVETTYETSGDDSWYDMQGRKIDKPTKAGIYIQNRKKIVIR